MTKTWFGVSKFWGWYPASWEGWIVLVAMVGSLSSTALIIDSRSHSVSDTLLNIFPFASLILAFTILVATYKGRNPAFGKRHKDQENFSPDNPKAYILLPLLLLPLIVYYVFLSSFFGAFILGLASVLLFSVYRKLIKTY